jgi:hypothetical protein
MLVIVPLWLIAFSTALSVALGLVIGWSAAVLGKLGKPECNCCPVHDNGETVWAKPAVLPVRKVS